MHIPRGSFVSRVDLDPASITVHPAALAGLAGAARAAAPVPADLAAVLAAGAQALAGLSSAAALAEVGAGWVRRLGDLECRWRALAAGVDRAGQAYDAVDTELAS